MIDKLIIKCPKCGYQYLPSEIFIPNNFLGEAHDALRNAAGKIICCAGSDPDLTETYVCDNCDTHFQVDATISFKVKEIENKSSDKDGFDDFQ